jgi:metal-responsive CopG/Arc/MetJ family transcriptional regulator
VKVAVSIPDALFEKVEQLAGRLGLSRSRLYTLALQHFVEGHDDETITAKLNEIYATEPSALDPILQSIQSRSVKY